MKQLKEDEKLNPLIEEYGELALEKSDNPFQSLVASIINQQLSTASAESIRSKFFERFEITPASLLKAGEEDLAECGLSSQKIDYIQAISETFLEDGLNEQTFAEMSDNEVVDELTGIHGVGVWTAKMFLINVLGREDVFPVEDLGIRRAMENLYSLESRGDMRDKAEEWKPYRSYASLYLWRSRD
ncbi:MAG: DNA-3-methyladenine glycosylase II [Candidatus Nanohaloarchaea archaeon]|jgi:DNA-3-methyladenine glycosylase II